MVLESTLLYIAVPLAFLSVLWLYRKRLIRHISSLILTDGMQILDGLIWVPNPEGEGKLLSPWTKAILSQVTPILVVEGVKAVKLKMPASLPLNPITGQLDFMAPILQKIASGKKVGFEDFLPVIMEKAMPLVEGFLGKAASGVAPSSSSKPPKELEL